MSSVVIRTQEMAVLDTLRGVMKKYGKNYCYPSQNTILALLKKCHGLVICRRTLNYWLKRLTEKGLIHRIKRHYRDKNVNGQKVGSLHLRSTGYYLRDKIGSSIQEARKFIGLAKRLRSIYPSAVQKAAPNKIKSENPCMTEQRQKEAAPVKEPPASFEKGLGLLKSWGINPKGVNGQ